MDPIIPFFGDDRFTQLSPLRRIPVLTDDQVTLPESSVIWESFKKLKSVEERLLRTKVANHRSLLIEMGLPIAEKTCGTREARRGVLNV